MRNNIGPKSWQLPKFTKIKDEIGARGIQDFVEDQTLQDSGLRRRPIKLRKTEDLAED